MFTRGVATALLLAALSGCSKAPPFILSAIDQVKSHLGKSAMPFECSEFVQLVIAQAQHNVESAATPDSKKRNQAILDSLNNALAQEAAQKPPKAYDAAQCKSAVDNWKAVSADGPTDALSAEKIAQQDPAYQAATVASIAASAAASAAADAQKAAADVAALASSASAPDSPAAAQSQQDAAPVANSGSTTQSASSAMVSEAGRQPAIGDATPAQPACTTSVDCAKAMLAFARTDDLAGAMQAAKAIDALPRPARGDRAAARELNRSALAALNASKADDAVKLLEEAHQTDPGDEEVVSNLAYAYSLDGQLAKSEDTAVIALSLNPRRTSVWAPLAVTLAKENRADQAVEAMWLAFQFSADRQKTLDFIDSRLSAESDPAVKSMYERSKDWFTQNQKPAFNS